MSIPKDYNYYVIKFKNLPSPMIPQVVFVPHSWVRSKSNDISMCISYPREQLVAAVGRIIAGDGFKQEWDIFVVDFLAGFDTIEGAQSYIESRGHQSNLSGVGEDLADEDSYDEVHYEPEQRRKRVSFSSSQVCTPKPSLTAPDKRRPPKRRPSATQTSSQAMTELPQDVLTRVTDPDNRKIRISKDIRTINRLFDNVRHDFEDISSGITRITSSINDIRSLFTNLANTAIGLLDDLDEPTDNGDVDVPSSSTHMPRILKPIIATKIEGRRRSSTTELSENPFDSKWTLRHREKVPGVTELMPDSGVYLSTYGFQRAIREATDAKNLARMLLKEIFCDYALRECSLAGGKNGSDRVRPGLDKRARAFLIEFVKQYSRQRGWEMVEHSVLMSLRNKLLEMRRNGKPSTSGRQIHL